VAREPRCRHVEKMPAVKHFKPGGIPGVTLQKVVLKVEELEAIRLKDLLGWEQEECAVKMQVSRPTFQRILIEGRAKIADALVNGKEILIEGGDYCLGGGTCRRQQRRNRGTAECPYLDPAYMLERDDLLPQASAGMVAVCSRGNLPASSVDGRFGRCTCFMIWNPENGVYSVVENSGNILEQGAGTGAAYELIKQGVEILLASKVGAKAFSVLSKAGIRIFGVVPGITVENAIQRFASGELMPLDAPNEKEE